MYLFRCAIHKLESRVENDFHRKLYGLLFSNRLGTYLAGFIIATRSNNLLNRAKAIVRKQMAKQTTRVGLCSGLNGIAQLFFCVNFMFRHDTHFVKKIVVECFGESSRYARKPLTIVIIAFY